MGPPHPLPPAILWQLQFGNSSEKDAWIREGYCFTPGANFDQESGKLSCLSQSTPIPCCTPTASRYIRSGCPLSLAAKCCGFICRTRAPAEVDHEPVILSPQTWEERNYVFTYKYFFFYFLFFSLIVATQRKEKQRDALYELGSLQMLPWALVHGTGSTAVNMSALQDRRLSWEWSRKANSAGRRAEGQGGGWSENVEHQQLISEDPGETGMGPGLRDICARWGLSKSRNKHRKGDESEHMPYVQNLNGKKTFSSHCFNMTC